VNRRLRVVLVIGTVGLVAAAVAGAAIGFGGGSTGTTGRTGQSLSTTPVSRATLTQTQQVSGTLGYGAPVTVNGRGSGVITWLPALGATLRRGRSVYRADDHAVSLFYGSLPLYRPLHSGDTGDDVAQVERNLAALGYTGFTVDTRYTWATDIAVRLWQKDSGLTPTGVFNQADVVVASGKLRVASLAANLGDPATNGPVLRYTGTTRTVQIALDVALQGLVRPGIAATVTLPGGGTVVGTVTAVGPVATPGAGENDPATIEVTVTVANQSAFGTFDQAPVAVELVSGSVANVLTVPVAALVALAGGGYGVQVVTGATNRYVPVQLGMFADGRVQISGDGIAQGMVVRVAL
jgi:hypothetical protein